MVALEHGAWSSGGLSDSSERETFMCAQSRLQAAVPETNVSAAVHSRRLLVVSPSTLEREGLSLVLERGGFDAYAIAPDSDAIKAARATLPDLILVDVPGLPGFSDAGRILELRHIFPDAHIVLLSERLNPEWLFACRDATISGYLSKSTPGPAVYRQLHLILEGERILPMKILREIAITAGEVDDDQPPEQKRAQALTKRDIDVLRLLVAGHSNKMIADRLKIAESTVKVIMKAVFAKIRVTNRTQAALWALHNGIQSGQSIREREPTYT